MLAAPNLSREISTPEQVKAYTDDQLRILEAQHDAEITRLQGILEAMGQLDTPSAKRRALRTLHLHKHWIKSEREARAFAANKLEKAERRRLALEEAALNLERTAAKRAAYQAQQNATAARWEAVKLERQQEANRQDRQEIAAFKVVCREVLGDEMYSYLWQETTRRMGC